MPRKLDEVVDQIAQECVAVRVRMLNRYVSGVYDEALRPHGLKVSQMNILVAAAKMGVARPAEIGARLHLEVSTLSRNVERMKARGWLETVASEDRRAQPFRLTAAGRAILKKAATDWERAQQEVKRVLGGDAVQRLNEALSRIPKEKA